MEKFCQSCGMPLEELAILGTEKDGSKTEEYCMYCYENGDYTEPNITMKEMEDVCVSYMVRDGMEEAMARQMMGDCLPHLKRWK